jgi:ATP-binding cassette, subfamily B, bacterial
MHRRGLRWLSGRRQHHLWTLVAALHQAHPRTTVAWLAMTVVRGLLPPVIAVTSGVLVTAVTGRTSLVLPLTTMALLFVTAQVVGPVHLGLSNDLGDRAAASFHDRLMAATLTPAGIAHLERPDLAADLTTARDFELGLTAPPLSISITFIADDLVPLVAGVASALVLAVTGWWQALLLVAAWTSTHRLLRESGVWSQRRTPEVQLAQRHADYAYRLAVDPPAAKELRLFGLDTWVVDRFVSHRRRLYDLQFEATRLREQPTLTALLVVVTANGVAFWTLGQRAANGLLSVGATLVATQAAIGIGGLAFGGLSWALDAAAAPIAAMQRLEQQMPETGRLAEGTVSTGGTVLTPAVTGPAIEVRDLCFGYPDGPLVLDHFSLRIPAGGSLAIVGQNGAGKTTLAKLLCRFYDPTSGTITISGADGTVGVDGATGVDLQILDVADWRGRLTAVFQDFLRLELSLRDNVAPAASRTHSTAQPEVDDADVRDALTRAGAVHLADLDTVLSKAYPGGIDLSGGQWQRVALARALYAVGRGARLVLLDEPTAQLDVRGEAEIFERVLEATRGCTTILVSHRFSTVRRADLICVLEHGAVAELGSHDELMAAGGRYRTMFELQASRFVEVGDDGREVVLDRLD